MAKTVAIKCPSCGASSFQEVTASERSCIYCGTTFRVEAPESNNPRPVPIKRVIVHSPQTPGQFFHGPYRSNPQFKKVFHAVWFAFVLIIVIIILFQFFDTKSTVDKGFRDMEQRKLTQPAHPTHTDADREWQRQELERIRRNPPEPERHRPPPPRD